MKTIIFIIMIAQNIYSCDHTVAIHNFLREKIDSIMVRDDIKQITKEDVIKVKTYLEILDYVSSID